MEQGELLEYAVITLERLGVTYMIVGSFTSGAYGEPRYTNDIDIVVELRPAQVKPLCDAFPPDRFYVSAEAAMSAVATRGQFNVIDPESGNKIDFMISRQDPWGREQLRRRQRIPFLSNLEAFAARPEDVIIAKLIYFDEGGSDKHLRDITGIFTAGTQPIDRGYIEGWVHALNLTSAWEAVLSRLGK